MNDDEYLSIEKRPPETILKRIILDAAGREHGTPCGRMRLRGQLNERQFDACYWFDGLYERYLAAIGKARGIRTSTGERRDSGYDPDPSSEAGMEVSAKEAQAVAKYNAARVVAMGAGAADFKHFWKAVIDGEEPDSIERISVTKVASVLEKYRSRGWKSRRK
jgi:hypothetical protein